MPGGGPYLPVVCIDPAQPNVALPQPCSGVQVASVQVPSDMRLNPIDGGPLVGWGLIIPLGIYAMVLGIGTVMGRLQDVAESS